MKLIIVGGVAGGASAATRARRLSEDAEIVMFERGPDVSFANCGLPYYIGGEIADREKLLVAKADLLRQRFRLDVRTKSNVVAIDRSRKVVLVHDQDHDRSYEVAYDKIILAPGAAPLRPPIPGIDLPGIFTLRTLADSDHIKSTIDAGVKHAVIVGAGFIGLEMAENLVRRGISTTVVELQDQVLPPMDHEMTAAIVRELSTHGISLKLGQSAVAFEPSVEGISVQLKSGESLVAGLVVLGIGVRPENQLATQAGLAVGPRGGIQTDSHMRTSDPDIYAVGDAVEVRGYVSQEPTQVPLAGPANRQGRLAADHIFGRSVAYRGTQGTAILRVFGVTAAMTGETEKSLQRSKREYQKIYVHPNQHAGYYPGARAMTIKLLFESETGKLLGAQAVGGEGVDKRIDVLAIAIQAGMSVFDLEQAELAYSPQYGSAKDAINMAGFVASAVARGEYRQVFVEHLDVSDHAAVLVDVRTEREFREGAIPGAIHLPLDRLRSHLDQLPRDRPITVYCQAGQRGYIATRLLSQTGFDVSNLAGGYLVYKMYNDTRPQPA